MPHARRRALTTAAALLGFGAAGLAACADTGVTAPAAARAASTGPTRDRLTGTSGLTNSGSSVVVSQGKSGDTTVTVFVVGIDPNKTATFNIGNSSKIDFPYAGQSICDPATSSYGAAEWDKACTVASLPVQITAKTWLDASGLVRTDFQPAMRFVPGLAKPVTLYLKDPALGRVGRIDYCTPLGGCVDESLTDPSVVTYQDPSSGFLYRRIKHFSGYDITW